MASKPEKSGSHMAWTLRIPLELFLRVMAFWVTLFGPAWAYWWARRIAFIGWVMLPHSKIAIRNLELCFPDKSPTEHKRIAKASFRHFCYTFMDYLLVPKYMLGGNASKYVKDSGEDSNLAKMVKADTATVMFSAHLGNWELSGITIAEMGGQLACVVRDIRPPLVDRWINRTREMLGSTITRKSEAGRGIMAAIKNKSTLAILIDQNGGDHAPVETFFGVPVTWQWDIARIIVKRECLVYFTYALRIDEKFQFKHIDGPLREYAKGSDPMQVIRDYSEWLETAVREHPEQYFWLHKRFKAWKEGWPRRYENLGQSLTPEQYQKMLVVPGFENTSKPSEA